MRRPTYLSFLCLTAAARMASAAPINTIPQQTFDAAIANVREAIAAGRINEANSALLVVCPENTVPSVSPMRAGLCYHYLATISMKDNKTEEAPALFQKAADAWLAAGPDYRETWGNTELIVADLLQQQHQPARAEAAILRYLTELPPAEQSRKPEALSRLALAYGDLGRPELAREAALQALAAFDALPTLRKAEAAYAHNTLGVVSLSIGRQEEAEIHLRKAVQLGSEAVGEDHLETLGYQTNLALALLSKGDATGAETILRRARILVERQPAASGNQLGMIYAELSAVAVLNNKLAIAGEEARKAIDVLSRQKWPDQKAVALAQVNLADVYLNANRLPETESLLNQAVAVERREAPGTRLLADGIRRMGQLRAKQQRWREASELYREAIAIYNRVVGERNPAVGPVLREYAEVLRHDGGQKAEIRDVENRAKALAGFARKS